LSSSGMVSVFGIAKEIQTLHKRPTVSLYSTFLIFFPLTYSFYCLLVCNGTDISSFWHSLADWVTLG
jgi:hypothetical protein